MASSPAIGKPADTQFIVSEGSLRSNSAVVEHRAPPEQNHMGNYTINPQCKTQASTAVTPIQTCIPNLRDAAWAIGLVGVIIELLDEDSIKTRFKQSKEHIFQTIDYNTYLPLTTNGFTLKVK